MTRSPGNPVIVNGLPGKMASEVARQIVISPDFSLRPYALTGSRRMTPQTTVEGQDILLYPPAERNNFLNAIQPADDNLTVDYTLPDAAPANVELYCANNMPFVMGTTSADLERIQRAVSKSNIVGVVAPNLALQIVAFQRFMQNYSAGNSGALKGCDLRIKESHQQNKADTSGTAKAMVKYFATLGIPISLDNPAQLRKIRGEKESLEFGVEQENLGWHGYHTYEVTDKKNSRRLMNFYFGLENFLGSSGFREYGTFSQDLGVRFKLNRFAHDKSLTFEISYEGDKDGKSSLIVQHNANGGGIYAQGTLHALRFLMEKMINGNKGEIFTGIDVLDNLEKRVA